MYDLSEVNLCVNITDTQIIEVAVEELNRKSWAVTEQYLQIHEIVMEGDRPKVARVDRDNKDGSAIVYFPIKDEKFFLAIGVDLYSGIGITGLYMEPYNSVYFKAWSESLNAKELTEYIKFKPTCGISKGDPRGSARSGITWPYSIIFFEPNPEPDAFEDKLGKLLSLLEKDREGVQKLVEEFNGSIQVAIEFYYGNSMLGGPHIDKECIRRMSALNLDIDFDLYVSGQPFS